MAEHTYDDFHKLIGITTDDLTPDATEKIIEVAIGALNLFGAGLPELTGAEGTKSINCSTEEWSAIVQVTRMVYIDFYEDAGGDASIQDLEVKSRNYLTDPEVQGIVEKLAYALQQHTSSPYDNIILI